MSKQVIVIGGGAAGMFAAIRLKHLSPQVAVTVLESAPKGLGKVKVSGGGRCNVTHHCLDLAWLVTYYPRGQKELKGILSRFGPADTIEWFAQRGVQLKTEADGRMFPITDSSQTIIDCLRGEAHQLGVIIHTQTRVRTVVKHSDIFEIVSDKQSYPADAVLLATGGTPVGYQWAKALGHTVEEAVPSLFTFHVDDTDLHALAGLSVQDVHVRLNVFGQKPLMQSGPLLITHWGLSGPAILKLSAWGARHLFEADYQAGLAVDFFPLINIETLQEQLRTLKNEAASTRQIGSDNPPEIPKRLWHYLLAQSGFNPSACWPGITHKALNRLAENLKRFCFTVCGRGVYKDEFVTAGGITLNQIDCRTMQSKICPGTFWAGEILNIDGMTGGFNFQNAWATGWIAAQGISDYLDES